MTAAGEPHRTGGLRELRLAQFRCFDTAVLEPGPGINLLIGENGAGKTSLLEAIYLLGRGASFRAARPDVAIRHDQPALTAFGRLGWRDGVQRVGIEVRRREGIDVRLDGQPGVRADLARALPVALLDPAGHEWVQGAPAERRRFLDWAVFHVEHAYWEAWQNYRRALAQRNAGLRQQDGRAAWVWDDVLITAGEAMDACRRRVVSALAPAAVQRAGALAGLEVSLRYSGGWRDELSLREAIEQARERDLAMGSTQVGPHRADLLITIDSGRARERVSRGQEKLLVTALCLAQVELVSQTLAGRVVLLVDEPVADLDRARLAAFQMAIQQAPAQVFMTALDQTTFDLPADTRTFHVEQGTLL